MVDIGEKRPPQMKRKKRRFVSKYVISEKSRKQKPCIKINQSI